MKGIGCISKTEDGSKIWCSNCSFADNPAGNNSKECKDFRKLIGGRLFYSPDYDIALPECPHVGWSGGCDDCNIGLETMTCDEAKNDFIMEHDIREK